MRLSAKGGQNEERRLRQFLYFVPGQVVNTATENCGLAECYGGEKVYSQGSRGDALNFKYLGSTVRTHRRHRPEQKLI